MSKADDIRENRSPEDNSTPSNTETTSASGAPLPEPLVTQKAKAVCAGPATSNFTQKKELNANPSVLAVITDLPIEIFAEIASLIRPEDLLALARSSKPLRSMLMRSSVAFVWRCAETNVEGLPPCPEDMCEPQYAALLLTNHCTSCGKKTTSQADPFLRVRLCSVCREMRLVALEDSWERGTFSSGLVPVTRLMKFKLKNAPRRMFGADSSIEYCLAKDVDDIVSQHINLMNTHDNSLYQTWTTNRRSYVEKRHQFGRVLAHFQWSVERKLRLEHEDLMEQRRKIIDERLRELGWSFADLNFRNSPVEELWRKIYDQPTFVDDRIWGKLLAELLSLVGTKPHEPPEKGREERKQERRKHVYTLLQKLKPRTNPFARLLEKLGFDPSQTPNTSGGKPTILHELVNYPFPNYATVLEAPCLDDVNKLELSIEEVERLFYECQEKIEALIVEWREQGERKLVELWKEEGRNASSVITGNATILQLSNTDILLRADTIFVRHFPGNFHARGSLQRYPNLTRAGPPNFEDNCHVYNQWPSKMVWKKMYRHFEAEKITKAILGRHDMPDVTYYELKALGAVFVCERCEYKEPLTWYDMLEHYMYEGTIWHQQTQQDPIIETSVPIPVLHTHDPAVNLKPFVRILDDGDKDEPTVPATLSQDNHLDCLICRNRHHWRTLGNLEEMKRHLFNVHEISTVWGDIMYEPSSSGGRFYECTSEWQETWKCQWDSYYRLYL